MSGIVYLPVHKIVIKENSFLTKQMSEEEFEKLKTSITNIGMVYPIIVRDEGDGSYRVIEGRHRYKAVVELGWSEIPCIVLDKDASPQELYGAMYDPELFRKHYTVEEIEKFIQERDQKIEQSVKAYYSRLANQLPPDVLQKIAGELNINSVKKLDRLLSAVLPELKKKDDELFKKEQEIESLKERIAHLQNEVKEKESLVKAKIDNLKAEIDKRIDEEVQKRLQLISSTENLSADKLKEIEEKIRAEQEEKYAQFLQEQEQKIKTDLQQELNELHNNLVEISRKYREAQERINKLKEERDLLLEENRNLAKKTKESTVFTDNVVNTLRNINPVRAVLRKISVANEEVKEAFDFVAGIVDENLIATSEAEVNNLMQNLNEIIENAKLLKAKIESLREKRVRLVG
ncbi:MAG: ParB N-terminal domain-containing protein [Dictyoglomus turgidum]